MSALRSWLIIAALWASCTSFAAASGTATITKNSGSERTYLGVRIHMLGNTGVKIVAKDGRGSLTIRHAACSYAGDLRRCLPYRVTLDQHGAQHVIDLQRGTLYVNTTGAPLSMPHSSNAVPPGGIVLGLRTVRGTIISVTGLFDK